MDDRMSVKNDKNDDNVTEIVIYYKQFIVRSCRVRHDTVILKMEKKKMPTIWGAIRKGSGKRENGQVNERRWTFNKLIVVSYLQCDKWLKFIYQIDGFVSCVRVFFSLFFVVLVCTCCWIVWVVASVNLTYLATICNVFDNAVPIE